MRKSRASFSGIAPVKLLPLYLLKSLSSSGVSGGVEKVELDLLGMLLGEEADARMELFGNDEHWLCGEL